MRLAFALSSALVLAVAPVRIQSVLTRELSVDSGYGLALSVNHSVGSSRPMPDAFAAR